MEAGGRDRSNGFLLLLFLFIFESSNKVALKITLSVNTKSLLCVNREIYIDWSYTKLKSLRRRNHVYRESAFFWRMEKWWILEIHHLRKKTPKKQQLHIWLAKRISRPSHPLMDLNALRGLFGMARCYKSLSFPLLPIHLLASLSFSCPTSSPLPATDSSACTAPSASQLPRIGTSRSL